MNVSIVLFLSINISRSSSIFRENSVFDDLKKLKGSTSKKLILVVDSGALYDEYRTQLVATGIPVFKNIEVPLKALTKIIQ